jgi:hypothetical protein
MISLLELTTTGLSLISSITKNLSDAHAGTITPDQALAQIAADHAQLAADRAVEDKALADRFIKT